MRESIELRNSRPARASCTEELTQDGAPTGRALWRVTGAALAAVTDGTCPQAAATLIARVAGLEPTLSH